jgi:hypothetical protein
MDIKSNQLLLVGLQTQVTEQEFFITSMLVAFGAFHRMSALQDFFNCAALLPPARVFIKTLKKNGNRGPYFHLIPQQQNAKINDQAGARSQDLLGIRVNIVNEM